MHDETWMLIEVGALLLGLSLLGRLAIKYGQSPIPLYMTAGLVFGSGGLLPLHASIDFLSSGAELGVVLLLVMLGLEYSPTELVGNLKSSARAGIWDGLLNAVPGAVFALILGWGPIAALVMAGVTWVSSSGVIAKVLRDLGRLGNRETPIVLSVLVLEDLAMAFYLPILSAVVIGASLLEGAITVAIAVGSVTVVLYLAVRHGKKLSRIFHSEQPETLLMGVLGLTMLVAGLASEVQVSAAVGAFLVGIALSGQVAHNAEKLLAPLRDLFAAIFFVFFGLTTNPADIPEVFFPALILAAVTMSTKVLTGYLAAKKAGIGRPGRWRTGVALMPRGEFTVIIAGLAVSAGVQPLIAPLAATYMLITVISGPVLARITDTAWFKQQMKNAAKREGALAGSSK
ncbi:MULTISPECIES: cation:proton antiporter [Aurantimicrobium]|jgi:CPA2 family monovalent cation:H+ antiporter-2|uniref:K(+)/H(+) antiporter YhaU n=1 Tax=Aurantimicrobium photophilum TaxID=1987356 RepID=A0A2Z3S4H8_9MICO|nr:MULTISPECIES: cation:proton antiporter [Aurantimicrobium]AWR21212.1 K(+)/H(+) antiporter YhaU [Aurantimicrobium photophilum]MDH6255249.1 CPA2 family monovalent cation:H+ antiporter-2 [Aurantimicrobium minutum]